MFIAYLDIRGYALAIIVTYVSALSYCHKIKGIIDLSNTFVTRKLLKSVSQNKPKKKRLQPITIALLKKILLLCICKTCTNRYFQWPFTFMHVWEN